MFKPAGALSPSISPPRPRPRQKRTQRKTTAAKITQHHKRPKAIGGNNSPENISKVPAFVHESWHLLFNHMSVPKIVECMNTWELLEKSVSYKRTGRVSHIQESHCLAEDLKNIESFTPPKFKDRYEKAWHNIVAGAQEAGYENVLAYINDYLLDPAYEIVLSGEA